MMRSEERPTNKVPCLDRLEPCRFDWVATYLVHPLHCLFGGREIVYAVGMAKGVACLLRCGPRLPIAFVLYEWDLVPTVFAACFNEEGFTLASDEYILFFVDGDAGPGEDGNDAIIASFADTHEGMWEVLEGVGLCRSGQ